MLSLWDFGSTHIYLRFESFSTKRWHPSSLCITTLLSYVLVAHQYQNFDYLFLHRSYRSPKLRDITDIHYAGHRFEAINPWYLTLKCVLSSSHQVIKTLQWRRNESNHQPHDCLLKRLFRRRSKKTSKLRVTGHCEGNSPVIGEFPSQKASNAAKVSIVDFVIVTAIFPS